jgi:SAM-dependent methyltransferase
LKLSRRSCRVPIGSYAAVLRKSPLKRTMTRLLGTDDLDGHFRIRPLLEYISASLLSDRLKTVSVIEFGCGNGINLFEIAARIPVTAIGYDLNPEAIRDARRTAEILGISNIDFRNEDATVAAPECRADLVLLIDFLEHIPEPNAFLRRCDELLVPGGQLLISVPTPRFRRVFGDALHRAVGHLVDGYRLEDLQSLLPGYTLITHRFNTGLLASILCAIYYRVLIRIGVPVLGPLLRLACLPFARFDWLNARRLSCSLFAVFQKPLRP